MERFARLITEHPKRVALVFVLLTVFFGLQLLHLQVDFTPQAMFNKRDPDFKVYESFVEQFGSDDSFLLLLLRGGEIFSPRGMALLEELTERLDAIDDLKNIRSLSNLPEIRHTGKEGFSVIPFMDPPPQSPGDYRELRARAIGNPLYHRLYISSDGNTAAITAELRDGVEQVDQVRSVVEKVEAIADGVIGSYPEFEVLPGGIPYVRVDIIRCLLSDQMKFLPICAVMLFCVSYLTFRRLREVFLLMGTVTFIIIWGIGILSLCGGEINVLTSTLPSLVMIIGVADSIHLMRRYDEEIRKGRTRTEAIYWAVRHIGAACFFTSFTTAVAFASLGVSTNALLSSYGIYASLAILAAYAVTLTLLPLLLTRWGRQPRSDSREAPRDDRLGRLLDRSANFCIRHPRGLFFVGLAVVVFSLFGALRTGMSNSLFEFYRKDSPVYQSNLAIEESLAGITPYGISFEGEQGLFKDPDFLERLSLLQEHLEKDPLVRKTLSLADFIEQMHWAFHGEDSEQAIPSTREAVAQYLLLYSLSGNEEDLARFVSDDYAWGNVDVRCDSEDSDVVSSHINNVKETVRSLFSGEGNPIRFHITGIGVFAFKTLDNLMQDMIKSVFMACVIIFIVIAVEFRSLRIALISMIPNLIPVLFTYGVMGWLGIKLQLSSVVVFSISLGIAVDDSIHFLVRFREEFAKHGDHEKAIQGAFRGAGRAIVYTTVILVLGLGVLTLSSLPPTVRFAYLTATTLTSALLADLFVLPACILVFRTRVWSTRAPTPSS